MDSDYDAIKKIASVALNTGIGQLSHFNQVDTFNPENTLDGFISMKQNEYYGSLYIHSVNNEIVPQLVAAMPKIGYPFTWNSEGDRIYHWPHVYEFRYYTKLDGSNVVAYTYKNKGGETFVSYKMRTSPFMKESRWGNWPTLWQKILVKYPQIYDLAQKHKRDGQPYMVSFELYGNENPHMVTYNIDLDVSILLFRTQNGKHILPGDMLDCMGIPYTKLIDTLNRENSHLATEKYNEWREIIHNKNISMGPEEIVDEGMVVYAGDHSRGYTLLKLKPSEVEEYAWKQGLNKKHIISAVMKVIESDEDLSVETVKNSLLDDFAESDIDEFTPVIQEAVEEKLQLLLFREDVQKRYRLLYKQDITIEQDKRGVMRYMSQFYDKKQMAAVYQAIVRYKDG